MRRRGDVVHVLAATARPKARPVRKAHFSV